MIYTSLTLLPVHVIIYFIGEIMKAKAKTKAIKKLVIDSCLFLFVFADSYALEFEYGPKEEEDFIGMLGDIKLYCDRTLFLETGCRKVTPEKVTEILGPVMDDVALDRLPLAGYIVDDTMYLMEYSK